MRNLSEIIIQHPEVNSFNELMAAVRKHASADGEVFLNVDIKPDYRDTPRDWQWRLEAAFTGGER